MARAFGLKEYNGQKKVTGWQGFKEAFSSHGLFIAGGLIIGLALIIIAETTGLKERPEWLLHIFGLSLEHLGLGLIVSSIAVFGYEWRSHVKKVLDLSRKLEQSIHDVEQIRETIRETGTLLELLSKSGDKTLEPALRTFLGEENPSLCKSLRQFVEAIYEIQRDKADDVSLPENEYKYRKLVKKRYIGVTEWLLQRTVLANARQFQKVIDGGEGHFTVPATSGEMADVILAAQMSIMSEGDSYDVISDVSSWRDNLLKEFKAESISKIKSREVKVRRVFNLFRHGLPPADSSSYQEVCKKTIRTLYDHLSASVNLSKKAWVGYELKIFWEEELKKATESHPDFREHEFREAHFGLFIHKETREVTRFKVELENLSNMTLNWDPSSIERDVDLFKIMWSKAKTLDKDIIKSIEKELMKETAVSEVAKKEAPSHG